MLQKCANPGCTVPFRSLHEGKLFLAETLALDAESNPDGTRRRLRKREHFWLCADCAAILTLHFDATAGMITLPLCRPPVVMPVRPRSVAAGRW